MPAVVASYVEQLLESRCGWMATYVDLDNGTLQCVPADSKCVASIARLQVNALVARASSQTANPPDAPTGESTPGVAVSCCTGTRLVREDASPFRVSSPSRLTTHGGRGTRGSAKGACATTARATSIRSGRPPRPSAGAAQRVSGATGCMRLMACGSRPIRARLWSSRQEVLDTRGICFRDSSGASSWQADCESAPRAGSAGDSNRAAELGDNLAYVR